MSKFPNALIIKYWIFTEGYIQIYSDRYYRNIISPIPIRRGELIFRVWAAGCQQVKRGVVLAADFAQCPWSRAETDGRRVDWGAAQWGRDVAGRGGQMMLTQLAALPEPESGSELSSGARVSQWYSGLRLTRAGHVTPGSDRPEQVI